MNVLPNKAKLFLIAILLTGTLTSMYAVLGVQPWHRYQCVTLLVIALVASRLKVKLPGMNGNMSVNLPFIMLAQAQLSPAEALLIACASTFVQCLPKAGSKLKPMQVMFNLATMAIAVEAGCAVFHQGMHLPITNTGVPVLAVAALMLFVVNTLPVAGIISLIEGARVMKTWSQIFHLSFPYYVASAGITSMVATAGHYVGWHVPLLVLAVAYGMYRSFQKYFSRMELMPRVQAAMTAESCAAVRA